MRRRVWFTFIFIVLLAVVSVWVVLPSSDFDIGGFKAAHPVREGLDLQGGLQVVLQAKPVAGKTVDANTMSGVKTTLEKRVNGLGVSEPLLQTRGNNQIIVELPGVKDPQEAINTLQKTALLEIIDPQGQYLAPGTIVNTSLGSAADYLSNATPVASPEASPLASPGATPVGTPAAGATPVASPVAGAKPPGPAANGPTYETIISGADLKDAYPTTGSAGVGQVVGFELQGDGAKHFFEFTSQHLGQPMSIVIDKQVISSPVINGAISGRGIIEGVPPAEVNSLVIQLKAGALDVPLEVIESQTVSPTLGRDSIDRSVVAGGIGLAIVALFMVLYYRLPGFLSVIALLIYSAITFAIFKIIPVTLTLAGIAGFILSIGMAVDANVLIFARIKDEIRLGRPLVSAVEAGFDHAWPSIRDSNISTMITTFILYLFGSYSGTSIITGFALTLFIGVCISMFTAITVTRTFLRLVVGTGFAHDPWWFGVNKLPPTLESPGAAPAAAD